MNTEVEGLRAEFLELKTALKQQLELTAGLASQVGPRQWVFADVFRRRL